MYFIIIFLTPPSTILHHIRPINYYIITMSRIQTKKLTYLYKYRNKNLLVTPYHWPDIDGIASSYALAQFLIARGNTAKAMKWQQPQMEAIWAMNKLNAHIPDIVYNNEDIILVDVSDPKDIPQFLPLNKIKTIIDHRLYYDLEPFTTLNHQDDVLIEAVGSASSLITQICQKQNFIPSTIATNLLYLAIMSNTIKCRSHNTTVKDKKAIQWLSDKISVNIETVNEMFSQKSKICNIKKSINDDLSSKLQKIEKKEVAVAQLQIINSEQFLDKNKQEIIKALEQIKAERNADDIFLIVLDIFKCCTSFVVLSQGISESLKKLISLSNQAYYLASNDLWLRKQVIKMLQQNQKP